MPFAPVMTDNRGETGVIASETDAIAEARDFAQNFSPSNSTPGQNVTEFGAENSSSEQATQPEPEAQPPEAKKEKQRKTYKRVDVPTPEQIMQEDFMNNCAIRTGLSGVMGIGLGAMFGIAMGTFDTAGTGLDGHTETTKQTTRQAVKEMFRNTSRKSWY